MAKQEEAKELSLIEQLVAALKASSGNDEDSMRRRAKYEAEARELLEKRENLEHPHMSVYSHPEGDIARPKDKLKCKMFWVGYDMTADQLTPEEIRLLNLAKAGDYQFSRTDGSPETLTISGTNTRSGQLERLEFLFACRGDNKHNLPSLTTMLRQVFGQPTAEDELLSELTKLRAQLASA
jgi:hypothetical protein